MIYDMSAVVVGDDMLLNESGGRHRASWRPSSAEMIREEETKETWRGMKNDEERVRVGWRQPDRNSGAGGGFIPGKRRSVSVCMHPLCNVCVCVCVCVCDGFYVIST